MRLHSECEISIRGKRPERALNIFADSGIVARGVVRVSETEIKLFADTRHKSKVRKLCETAGLEYKFLCEYGLNAAVTRLHTRYVLWAAPLIVVFAVVYLSFFVWDIEVIGNDKVSTAEILQTLDEFGFGVGNFAPHTDAALLSNQVLSRLSDLSFMAINIHGSKADVIVRERRKPPKPTKNFEPPQEIFKQFSASIPLRYISKRYTGQEFTKNALIIGNFRINFYFSSGNYSGSCDIIEEKHRLQILGYSFPICLNVTRCRPWVAEQGSLTVEEAAEILKSRLSKEISGVIEESYSTESSGGLVTVKRSVKLYE
ncbi:MAG: sporulation protein YqfD [Oscillospiraceae bacterium]|jgi:hypothetical protein|nr:sporulation protein YqfD [Oscillospiraceae bacterium]